MRTSFKAALIMVPLAALPLTAISGPASAEELTKGTYKAVERVTFTSSGPSKGKIKRDWKVQRGNDGLKVTFRNSDGKIVHNLDLVKETGAYKKYVGTVKYSGNCYSNATGNLLDGNAYRVTSEIRLKDQYVQDVTTWDRELKYKRKAGADPQCAKTQTTRLVGEFTSRR